MSDAAPTAQEAPAAENTSPGLSAAGFVGAGAGIVALLLVLRVLAVAHWDWNVAGHILDAFDFGSAAGVAMGTLFANAALAAVVIGLIAPVSVLSIVHALRRRSSILAALATAVLCTAMLLSLAFTAGAWWGIVIAIALTGALLLVTWMLRSGALHDAAAWIAKRLGFVVLLGLLALVIGVQEPWASLERVTMSDGTVHDVYVLSETSSGMHVLVPGGDVEILMNADVQDREYP